jgi:hypothetical protein
MELFKLLQLHNVFETHPTLDSCLTVSEKNTTRPQTCMLPLPQLYKAALFRAASLFLKHKPH